MLFCRLGGFMMWGPNPDWTHPKSKCITSSTAIYYILQLYHHQFSIFFQTRAMGFEKVIITAGTAGQRAARGAQVTVHCTGISINVSITWIITITTVLLPSNFGEEYSLIVTLHIPYSTKLLTELTLEGYGKNGDLKVPFWSTKDAGQKPFTFQIGLGNVIKGWDEGVAGMDLGETARVSQ